MPDWRRWARIPGWLAVAWGVVTAIIDNWSRIEFVAEKAKAISLPAFSVPGMSGLLSSPLASPIITIIGFVLLYVSRPTARSGTFRYADLGSMMSRDHPRDRAHVSAAPAHRVSEMGFGWWHIEIGGPGTADEPPEIMRVFMLLGEGKTAKELQLMWPTNDGPVEEMVLRYGMAAVQVPVVARAERGDVFVSGDPKKLPHLHLPAGIARITDLNAIKLRANCTDLDSGPHRFRLCVRSVRDPFTWAARQRWSWYRAWRNRHIPLPCVSLTYVINVPQRTESNERFNLIPLDD
jgi:hypothetical protein